MRLFELKKWLSASCILTLTIYMGYVNADGGKNETHFVTKDFAWQKTSFGPDVWSVSGDFTKGQHITYIKFTAGMITPLHIHSADYVGIVLTGTTRHWIPGQENTYKILPAGSHWSIPANIEHVSECLPGVECLMAIQQQEAFDFIPRGKAPKIDFD